MLNSLLFEYKEKLGWYQDISYGSSVTLWQDLNYHKSLRIEQLESIRLTAITYENPGQGFQFIFGDLNKDFNYSEEEFRF